MLALKQAVAESRKTLASSLLAKKRADEGAEGEPVKKYFRRGEIAQIAKEKYEASVEQEQVVVTHTKDRNSKMAEADEPFDDDGDDDSIDPDEVKRRLRGYAQPITLFAESHSDRLRRLKLYELLMAEKHGGSMGTGHELQAIIAQEVDSEIVNATLAAMENEGDTEETKKAVAKQEKLQAKRHNKYKEMRTRDEFETAETFIIFFFKRMLLVWEEELNARTQEEKASTKGKVASATQKQTRQYMNPLFRLLKKEECPKDVVKNTEVIVARCIEREYVKANEAYLKMAIGNAAWPMGVTMVGIHERAGREKIFSQNVAHVLNNEMSRKYIQGIKRIMTFCQHAYPTAPSKMVV